MMEIMFTILIEPHPVWTGDFIQKYWYIHDLNRWIPNFGLQHFYKAVTVKLHRIIFHEPARLILFAKISALLDESLVSNNHFTKPVNRLYHGQYEIFQQRFLKSMPKCICSTPIKLYGHTSYRISSFVPQNLPTWYTVIFFFIKSAFQKYVMQ